MPADDVRSLQRALVDLLRKNGTLTSAEVAEAFLSVPRHIFLPGEPVERAYEDIAIQVRAGPDGRWTSSSSQPSIMAIMLEQLELRPGLRVLEIGAGTGYNAALMAVLVGSTGSVTAVDIQPDLVEDANAHLRAAGAGNVRIVTGDGGYGWPEDAPYDRIILTASSATITPAWRAQLAEGGRLVLPLDLGGMQVSTAFERRGEALVSVSLRGCGFMPLQGSFSMAPHWQELAPRISLTCPRQSGDHPLAGQPSALMGWLEHPGEGLRAGLRLRGGDLWEGVLTWLTVQEPDRGCFINAEDQALAAVQPPLPVLQSALISFSMGETTVHMWLLLHAEQGGVLLRRAGEEDGIFDLEALPLGEGETAARALLEDLRAWDAAGRPRHNQLRIRAVDAESGALPGPGERLLARPWTNFMVGYRQPGGEN